MWMSHGTNESWHTNSNELSSKFCHVRTWHVHVPYYSVMWHVQMSHFTWLKQEFLLMSESCHTHEWAMSHIWTSHVPHLNESCPTFEWVMSHTWMNYVTHMNESCPTYGRVMSHIVVSCRVGTKRNVARPAESFQTIQTEMSSYG